jgi:ribosomal protein L34E
MTDKKCNNCFQILPLDNFYKRGSHTQARQGACKKCTKEIAESRGYGSSKEQQKLRRDSRKSRGLCSDCLKPVLLDKLVCEKHYIYQVTRAALGKSNTKIVKQFSQKFYENPYCPYTGDKLIMGENVQLDHIKSQKRHPDLSKNIDNLEWVSKQANISKSILDKEEFIAFCKNVASRF